MEDNRVWEFESSLWTADADHYRESIDPAVVMVVPQPPYALTGEQAVEAVIATPRWTKVDLTERRVSRPQEGLIAVGYHVRAERDGVEPYEAWCTSTYRWLSHDNWKVVQHQQTPVVSG
ncbi:DUF4440 domain-containing protein [Sphingomonas solaris]|uniref:DUF4440 domain-containing protein n=1 Tax=Alterirhizorhabdus solaris TaxID=2529389 RepID=A0A558R9V1_9SPHN|nr:DUF4440 domain-containing protein [Sphingomonas solaris]TVV76155.1 DUF4440 domain-containing protein [Sphingomonas solaris]